jgi:hypothetical protein
MKDALDAPIINFEIKKNIYFVRIAGTWKKILLEFN